MTEPESRLPEAHAQQVLARALELQAQRAGGLTEAQVREIAAELSIPEAALDQALVEYRAAGAMASPDSEAAAALAARPGRVRRSRILLAFAMIGGAFVLLMALFVILRLIASS